MARLATVGLIVGVLAGSAWAVPVVPNGIINDEITFNVGSPGDGTIFYDWDPGTQTGRLVSMPGNPTSGVIKPVSQYPGEYTFNFDIDCVMASTSGTQAVFNPGPIALLDAENGDAVLLEGTIDGQFTLMALFNTLLAGEIPFTVTGGTLANEFGPTGKLVFNFAVVAPLPIPGFQQDIKLGTTAIGLINPEPASALLLLAGVGLLRRTRR